jgi:hypothetical protein
MDHWEVVITVLAIATLATLVTLPLTTGRRRPGADDPVAKEELDASS